MDLPMIRFSLAFALLISAVPAHSQVLSGHEGCTALTVKLYNQRAALRSFGGLLKNQVELNAIGRDEGKQAQTQLRKTLREFDALIIQHDEYCRRFKPN